MTARDQPRLLVFTSSFPRDAADAAGIFVAELTRRLTRDFRVTVLTPLVDGGAEHEVRDGMEIFRFRQSALGFSLIGRGGIVARLKRNPLLLLLLPFFLLSQFMALRRVVKRRNIDIIHAHWALPQGFLAVVYRCCFRRRLKVVVTCHGSDILKVTGAAAAMLQRYTLRRADGVSVVSDYLRERVEALGVRREVAVAPMGVDTAAFRPGLPADPVRAQWGISGPLILFVGSIIELKGVRTLIEAMPAVLAAAPETTLLLVGAGPLREEMEQLGERLGVKERVIFAGPVPHEELPGYFAAAGLLALPSFSEGWPLVVMEALSSGLRVVVSDLPVFARHPERDRLFAVAPAGDVGRLAGELLRGLETPAACPLREREIRRAYAVEHFDLEQVAARYRRLLLAARERR